MVTALSVSFDVADKLSEIVSMSSSKIFLILSSFFFDYNIMLPLWSRVLRFDSIKKEGLTECKTLSLHLVVTPLGFKPGTF